MKRVMSSILALLAVAAMGLPLRSDVATAAWDNPTYRAEPPFTSGNSTPNVILLIDNSGSMTNRGCETLSCGVTSSGATSTVPNFINTTTYSGYFESLGCYTYDTTNTRFSKTTTRGSVSTTCAATEFDGNLLNWITTRRYDAIQKALYGGNCVSARPSDGSCPTTAGQITIRALAKFASSGSGHETTCLNNTAGVNACLTGTSDSYVGRVPTAIAQGGTGSDPTTLYFYLRGGTAGMEGSFCVDNDSTSPGSTQTRCNKDGSGNDGDAFNEGDDGTNNGNPFRIRVVVPTAPIGLLQQVGAQARLALMTFNDDAEGGRILVGMGLNQNINQTGTTTEIKDTNVAAIIDAMEEEFPATNTPLAEAFYDAVRYVAQINTIATGHTGLYNYPIAFSPGVGFATAGIGSYGTTEISALLAGEDSDPTNTLGYVADSGTTATSGRDPFVFGGNHTPGWGAGEQRTCCKTFVLLMTDGEPTADTNIPASLQDYAHSVHGQHCTGGSGTIHAANGTCNTNSATPAATLLTEHKTDYGSSGNHYLDDVAYWAHTVDLRQATIPVINVAGHDIPGMQNITLYTFFTFGNINGREILMQAAKQGGFDDVNNNGIPETGEYDKINNFTRAPGADGMPDTYFESANVDEIESTLLAIFSNILQQSTSGTSLSVLATSTTGEGALYQSFFFPKVTEGLVNVYWIGYTQALFLDTFGNLREDTDGDGRLVYKNDKIVKTRYDSSTGEVKADLFTDTSPSPDGDGLADSTTASSTVELTEIKSLWEAGRQLAERNTSSLPRNILTWLDLDNDGIVDSGEQKTFTTTNEANLRPYLRAASSTEGTNIITWIRGETVTGYRNRELTVAGTVRTWRFGDTIHSTPTVVGAPRERFDVLYGDISYSAYFQAYKDRRQVSYVGANDGMLHAFNVGFYNAGDDPTTSTKIEHGWFSTQRVVAPFVSNTPALGHELWAFIPQELLPQLKFLTQTDYQHAYYVDQKPKITDARIFCDGSAGAPTSPNCVTGQGSGTSHPNGWGTILLGSYRLGGSCRYCTPGATDLSVTADFNYDGDTVDAGDTRKFRSAYFALDITDPELDPKLLWVFTDDNLGLTLGYPAGARLRPAGGDKTGNSDARWFMVVGSGPTSYDVDSVQTGSLYVVDMVKTATTAKTLNTTYYTFATPKTCGAASPNSECSTIGNPVTVDTDFDYRADVLYFGNMICNLSAAPCNGTATPTWKGKVYRLTLASSTNPALGTETDPCGWGIGSSCTRTPTVLLGDFACTGTCTGSNLVGPVNAAVNVAQDDSNKIWVYWGTGRYLSRNDKTNADQQYFFGVKDPVPTSGCTQSTATNCEKKDLLNVSNAEVCVIGTTTGTGTCTATSQVSNVTGVDSFDSSSGSSNTLVGAIQAKDGWYTTLPDTRERALSTPAIIGGLVFFPTFVPQNDACSTTGSSFLYALYYKTGTAYKESVIGTEVSGSNTNVKRRTGIVDPGMASGVAVHMGAQGSGSNGSGGGGCQGQMTANIQSSTGSVSQTCLKTAGVPWSYYISWISQRE